MQLMGRALLRGVWAERVSGRSRPVLHGKRQNIGKDKSIADDLDFPGLSGVIGGHRVQM
jgi:hypothetical protein